MSKIQFRPTFVYTKNVLSFDFLMQGLQLGRGGNGEIDGRFACVWGRAGRGKTRTVQQWAAKHCSPYIETASIWTELDLLQAICRELNVLRIPGRRGLCLQQIKDAIIKSEKPIFIDELELCGNRFIEVARDIIKLSNGVVVLIGEEELPRMMQRNRRIWSRTFRAMEFTPLESSDIYSYVISCTGLELSPAAVGVMHKASGGDWRIVKRDAINLVAIVTSLSRTGEVTAESAEAACKCGLNGERRGA